MYPVELPPEGEVVVDLTLLPVDDDAGREFIEELGDRVRVAPSVLTVESIIGESDDLVLEFDGEERTLGDLRAYVQSELGLDPSSIVIGFKGIPVTTTGEGAPLVSPKRQVVVRRTEEPWARSGDDQGGYRIGLRSHTGRDCGGPRPSGTLDHGPHGARALGRGAPAPAGADG